MNILVARSMIIDSRMDRRTDRLRWLPSALYSGGLGITRKLSRAR